jgi:large subunit ribosomal protein L23
MALLGTKKKKEVKTSAAAAPVAVSAQTHVVRSVLKRPHASEKSYGLHAKNQYVFIVDLSANKNLVREEVERRYHVHVTDVGMLVNKGKVKQFRGRLSKASLFKKAFVTLKEGDKIEIV